MANRFGSSYEFEYNLKNPKNPITLGTSAIHNKIRQEAAERKKINAKKAAVKVEKERKKQYVDSGSGHKDIEPFFTSPSARSKRLPIPPVTDDRKKPRLQDQASVSSHDKGDDTLFDEELNGMIRNDNEAEDEAELERQEKVYYEKERKEYDNSVMDNTQQPDEEVQCIAVSYPKQDLDKAIIGRIEGHACKGCGNNCDDCHNQMFGIILTHEVLTAIQKMEPEAATDDWVEHAFTEKYRLFLRFHCFHMYGLYDERQDYTLPDCIKSGALDFTKTLLKHESIMYRYKTKRSHGVAEMFFGRAIVTNNSSGGLKQELKQE